MRRSIPATLRAPRAFPPPVPLPLARVRTYVFRLLARARLTQAQAKSMQTIPMGMARPPQTQDPDEDIATGVVTKTAPETKKPSLYRVLLLNDDYTPMEFVVMVLQRFFKMNMEEATTVMLHVHQKGVGVCGVFTYEVAETKVKQVADCARENQHPLQCTMEKA